MNRSKRIQKRLLIYDIYCTKNQENHSVLEKIARIFGHAFIPVSILSIIAQGTNYGSQINRSRDKAIHIIF